MPSYLDRILDVVRTRVATEKRHQSIRDLERECDAAERARPFLDSLKGPGISLIAEFKRRSPSKGVIRDSYEPAAAEEAYESAGASAMSVLTEPEFFGGSMDDLQAARAAGSLPVLRKDFMIDPYQVLQSRAGGADAILLVVAGLPDRGLLADLAAAAEDLGMAALVEIHDMWELERAMAIEPGLIGVNQRNLSTFEVDTRLAVKLRPEIPSEVTVVAESGITVRAEVQEMEQAGIDAILVGETLMRADDPSRAAAGLLGRR